jgi:predicted  nucleic acid-binding Zn-ribbon protein
MWDFPMNHRMCAGWIRSGSVLLTYLLLCGCERAPEQTTQAEPRSQDNAVKSAGEQIVNARSAAEQEALKRQRLAALTQELQTARAQQTALMQRQAQMSAQIAAQQEQGTALLASLKAQMQSQAGSSSGDPEAFKKNARMQLEAALEQDNELTAQFESLTAELQSQDSQVTALSAQLDALRAGTEIQK